MTDEAYGYLIGLSLLAHGAFTFAKRLQPFDKRSLHNFLAIANIFVLIFFICGFFLFRWYIPLLATMAIPIVLDKIHNDFFRYNMFFMFKDHLCILFGFVISAYAVLTSFF